MTSEKNNRNDAKRYGRILGSGLGIAAALTLATGGIAAAATTQGQQIGATGGVPATAANIAAVGMLPGTSVNVSPRIANDGSVVTISGEAPQNAHAGEWISLTSNAFVSKHEARGLPVIRAQVLVNGKYSVKATVRDGLKPADYVIAGHYEGRSFETATALSVRPYSTVTSSARVVGGGQQLTISGEAPKGAHAGEWITLQSVAFVSSKRVDGIPAIRAQVLVNGKYSTTATIARGLRPTTYVIAGSYEDQPLEEVAWITVR